MSRRDPATAIVVLTGKSVEHTLRDGGSQSWVLDRKNAARCRHLVCCRSGVDWVEGREPRGSAFLVGRVADVVPSTEERGRWLIRIDAFARLAVPDVWKGWRNPVRYIAESELGVDFGSLRFEPMPPPEPPSVQEAGRAPFAPSSPDAPTVRALTIAQAKKGLALTFGVSEDAIEITIRG